MVPIRTYWNSVEAVLEKSPLENYDVSCVLLYENANLYRRAPLAMPIRLVVEDDQADWARYILTGDFEAAAKVDRNAIGVHPANSEAPLPAVKGGRVH